jgi:hypothetical protein
LNYSAADPNRSVTRPLETRIERSEPAPNSLCFRIPPSGNWGGLLWIAIGWNMFTWFVAFVMVAALVKESQALEPISQDRAGQIIPSILLPLFILVGLGMIYMAIQHRYGRARVDLTPETIRLHCTLFGRTKTRSVTPAEVRKVSKIEFYKRCNQPVHGIEIEAAHDPLHFGSALSDEEKDWLCGELQEFLRRQGHILPKDDVPASSPGLEARTAIPVSVIR